MEFAFIVILVAEFIVSPRFLPCFCILEFFEQCLCSIFPYSDAEASRLSLSVDIDLAVFNGAIYDILPLYSTSMIFWRYSVYILRNRIHSLPG